MENPGKLSDLAEVISVDQMSETMQAALGASQYGPSKEELVRDDWVELEVVPEGSSPADRDLPFLIAPACEIDAGHQVQLSGALLITNLAYDDSGETEDPEELVRAVYLATGIEGRGGDIWTLSSPRRGGRIDREGLKTWNGLKYWDDTSEVRVECLCGWSGMAKETIREDFRELHTLSCPTCDTTLFIVSFPTAEETRAAAATGDKMAQWQESFDERREAFLERASKAEIANTTDLAEIDGGGDIKIDWDFEETDDDNWVVLRHDGKEIGRETAYFEGIDRFRSIFKLLIDKYGSRFVGLTPTADSKLYLFGDDLDAAGVVKHLNLKRGSQG